MFESSLTDWSKEEYITAASIWAMSLIGSLALFIAAWFYFKIGDNSIKMIYFIFTVIFIAFGISYSALSISVINKNTAS